MTLAQLIQPFPWSRYSQKLAAKIDHPRNAGFLRKKMPMGLDMRLVEGKEGQIKDGNCICFYWLIDKDDGIIVDAKFQAYGQSALIGAAEAVCDLLVEKITIRLASYGRAHRQTSERPRRCFRLSKRDISASESDPLRY